MCCSCLVSAWSVVVVFVRSLHSWCGACAVRALCPLCRYVCPACVALAFCAPLLLCSLLVSLVVRFVYCSPGFSRLVPSVALVSRACIVRGVFGRILALRWLSVYCSFWLFSRGVLVRFSLTHSSIRCYLCVSVFGSEVIFAPLCASRRCLFSADSFVVALVECLSLLAALVCSRPALCCPICVLCACAVLRSLLSCLSSVLSAARAVSSLSALLVRLLCVCRGCILCVCVSLFVVSGVVSAPPG